MKTYQVHHLPAELCWPSDYLLRSRAASEHQHYAQIGTVDRERLGLGKRTDLTMFNLDKLKRDQVFVDRRPFGGAGTYCGSGDVIYSFHINRLCLADPDMPVGDVFQEWNEIVREAICEVGVDATIRNEPGQNIRDGVCVNLVGRSEIVDGTGNKLVGSVFKDDGLIISIHGLVMVTDTWLKIYDYLKVPTQRARAVSLEQLVSRDDLTDVVVEALCYNVASIGVKYCDKDYEAMRMLQNQFILG